MRQDYYLHYYKLERTNWWFMAREKIIADQIRKIIKSSKTNNGSVKILNVGAATFRSSEMLKNFGEVVSIEYNMECVNFVAEELDEKMLCQSVTNLEFHDDSFDIVCAFDVVEHVEDDHLAISEIFRVCKTNGHVVLTVPALMSLWSEHDVINQHFRRYTLKELIERVPLHQCEILKKSYFNFLFFPIVYLLRRFSKKSNHELSESKSDFDKYDVSFLNKILYLIFLCEKWYLRYFNFLIGVSILFVGKKKL